MKQSASLKNVKEFDICRVVCDDLFTYAAIESPRGVKTRESCGGSNVYETYPIMRRGLTHYVLNANIHVRSILQSSMLVTPKCI